MQRFISAALTVCLALAPVPVDAQSAAPAIASLDRGSVKPFQKLVIRGSGFDPAGAIAVVFTPRARGSKVSVPVYAATSTTLEVIVPAIPDATNGFGFGPVDVQVIQITSSAVSASNVQSGLDVAPMTEVPSSIRKGALLRGYLRALRPVLEAAREGQRASNSTRDAVNSYLTAQAELLEKIDRVMADERYATTLSTGDSSHVVLDARALQFADRLLLAFMEGVASYTPTSVQDVAITADEPICDPQIDDLNLRGMVCDTAQFVVRRTTTWNGVAMLAAGAVILAGAAFYGVPLLALTGGASGVLVATIAANLVVGSVWCATLGAAADQADGLPFSEVLRDQGRKVLDTARESGAAIPLIATAAVDVFATAAHAAGIPTEGPRGGVAISVPGQDPPNGQTVLSVRGEGPSATTDRYTAPATQGTRSAGEARQPAPAGGRFDGSYSGTVSWFATDGPNSLSGTLGVSLSVAGGRVTVTAPVPGSGAVSTNGSVSGSAGSVGIECGWSGGFAAAAATGVASGGGVFSCTTLTGKTWGSWNASRR